MRLTKEYYKNENNWFSFFLLFTHTYETLFCTERNACTANEQLANQVDRKTKTAIRVWNDDEL